MSGDETEAHEVLRTEIETLRNWNSQKWHGKYQRWSSQKLSNMKLSEMNLGQIRNAPEKGNVETDMETEITLNWWTSQKFFFQKWIWIKLQGLRKEKGKQTWNRNDIESRMKLSETLLSEMNLNQTREPEKGKRETDMETGLPKGYTFKVEVNGLPALTHPIPSRHVSASSRCHTLIKRMLAPRMVEYPTSQTPGQQCFPKKRVGQRETCQSWSSKLMTEKKTKLRNLETSKTKTS